MLCGYKNGCLHVDGVDLGRIAAELATPCYVYSRRAIEARWREYDDAFGGRPHRVCYAVKANDNLSIIKVLHDLGADFDIVSGGELERVLAAGSDASRMVFSGVGKSTAEIEQAINSGVGCINVESADELDRISAAADATRRRVDVALRVNPDVDAQTHPYISTGLKENKFGIPIDEAMSVYLHIASQPHLRASGIACHIGSQLTTTAPVVEAVSQVVELAQALGEAGIPLEHVDVGGGLGIRYRDEHPPAPAELVQAVSAVIPERYRIAMEPGRSLVGAAGLLLTRVEYIKHNEARNFVIVDAAMNDLLRPALYDAWHEVRTYEEKPTAAPLRCDIVGPICESGDWLARDRELAVGGGDLIVILDTGAYGFVMSSNYNTRPRAPAVLIDGDSYHVIRDRETVDGLIANERARLIPR